jgi:hypothetical protein
MSDMAMELAMKGFPNGDENWNTNAEAGGRD